MHKTLLGTDMCGIIHCNNLLILSSFTFYTAADLGYSWAGKVPNDNAELLQEC